MATIGDIASFVQRYNKTERRIKEIEDAIASAQTDIDNVNCVVEVRLKGETIYRAQIDLQTAATYVQVELSSLQSKKDAMDTILSNIAVNGT